MPAGQLLGSSCVGFVSVSGCSLSTLFMSAIMPDADIRMDWRDTEFLVYKHWSIVQFYDVGILYSPMIRYNVQRAAFKG